jgi:hypothetical protein
LLKTLADTSAHSIRWQLLGDGGARLTFHAFIENLRNDSVFKAHWRNSIRRIPMDAFVWECPPITAATTADVFECVFLSSPSLARMGTDPDTFAEYFCPGCEAVTFDNLGGDATLVAPCPEGNANFAHLGRFTATASAERQDALWRAVGEAVALRIGPRPLWLSTAGHGVAWLHVRLDSRPKYYRHAPYMRS